LGHGKLPTNLTWVVSIGKELERLEIAVVVA